MKIKILFSLIFAIMGLYLGNAQNTQPDVFIEFVPEIPANGSIPAPDAGIINPFFVIQPTEGSCCSVNNKDCCEVGVTWDVNTDAIPPGLYSSFKLSAKWCGRNNCLFDTDGDSSNNPEFNSSQSNDAGIVLRSSSFDGDVRFLTPTDGARVDSSPTSISFEGEFPGLVNLNDLQIDFVQWFAEDATRWSNVILELYKGDISDCRQPIDINDVTITSNSYTFNWNPPLINTPDSYTWQIFPYNIGPTQSCPIAQGTTTETTATANNLIPANPYLLQIQSVCNGEVSEFKEKFFSTIDDGTPPANDKIENAIPIVRDCDPNSSIFIFGGNTESATFDEQEANAPKVFDSDGTFFAGPDTPTVWYSYTGNGTVEQIKIELCKTSGIEENAPFEIRTVLEESDINVFTGTPENLKFVGTSTENECGIDAEQSIINFTSDGTSKYYIAIDGSKTTKGYFNMEVKISTSAINPPLNDESDSPQALLNGNVIQGTLLNASPSIDVDTDTPCGLERYTYRDVWYTVELDDFSDLTVTILNLEDQNTPFALYSSNSNGTRLTWENYIAAYQDNENPEWFGPNDIGFVVDQDGICGNFYNSFKYKCLPSGRYFIRVLTEERFTNSFGIKAEVEPSAGNLASPGVLAIDKSLVFLDEVTGTADIVVKQEILANVPDGFVNFIEIWKESINTVASGPRTNLYFNVVANNLINFEEPTITFVVDEAGFYKVSNSVFNDALEFRTGGELKDRIERLGKLSCSGINVNPTIIEVRSACKADAAVGVLEPVTTPVIITGEPVTIEARQAGTPPDVLENYDITYVLTSGTELTILATSSTPSFQVSEGGTYRIHTLVAETSDDTDLNFLDLSTVNFGTTTADQILETLENNGLCGALDVVGATIKVTGNTLSSAGVKDNGFTVMPNPVKNSLSVSAKASIDSVIIYNMQGQSILRINPNTMQSEIDMSGLANGLYFIEVAINNTRETVRIVKQ